MKGVWRTRVGYAGGDKQDPNYQDVGDHSECIQIDFDPTVISYAELVDLMFELHDPVGNPGYAQYASLILAEDDEQLAVARERARAASARLGKPLTTRIEPLSRFWLAEEYHQKYYLRNDRVLMAQFLGMFGNDEAALRDSTAAMRVNGYVSGSGSQERLDGELSTLGLDQDAREHLVAAVKDSNGGAACALP